MSHSANTVVVLGAGINGCATARELLLNGLSVWLVDTADLSTGATSGSSRLIHGGLRYLEYGDFELVKESLAERGKLLRLAPHLVRPLELWIPTSNRFGGAIGAAGRFFGWGWWPQPVPRTGRGVWLISAGLRMYDLYAHDPMLPTHRVETIGAAGVPPVDPRRYRWVCSYFDAQVTFPERLVVSLLADCAQLAAEKQLDFRVLNYQQASLAGRTVTIRASNDLTAEVLSIEPAAIVNATGAWVDHTLAQLHVHSKRLMGGTKGTHLFTFHAGLRTALAGQGIYAEAEDGRPIFILPLADTVLIGTTDLVFNQPPEQAQATPAELNYLLSSVNAILPDARLSENDIDFHYSAVRPLPYSDASTPAAISRRHAIVRHEAPLPLFSLVGGKLTTMRSLAQSAAATVLAALDLPIVATSAERLLPGSENYPTDAAAREVRLSQIAARFELPLAAVTNAWRLVGTRLEAILAAVPEEGLLPDLNLPTALARWAMRHEWAHGLADLVERRLMLLYDPDLSSAGLRRLAEMLAEEGHLPPGQVGTTVDAEVARLAAHYGRQIR